MTETLFIRLGSKAQDTIHWLILGGASDDEAELIGSGELKGAEQLSELTSKAQHRQVKVLVPGCDVLLKSLNVPAKSFGVSFLLISAASFNKFVVAKVPSA